MLMGYYYGREEVEILFRRLYMAKDTTKEKIKKHILDGEYELDEESFLHLSVKWQNTPASLGSGMNALYR